MSQTTPFKTDCAIFHPTGFSSSFTDNPEHEIIVSSFAAKRPAGDCLMPDLSEKAGFPNRENPIEVIDMHTGGEPLRIITAAFRTLLATIF